MYNDDPTAEDKLTEIIIELEKNMHRPVRMGHRGTSMLIATYDPVGFCEHGEEIPASYNQTLDFLICSSCHKRRDRRGGEGQNK